MAYLALFHWGWLSGSLLLGLAMGWISVVHRGPGLSKRVMGWLVALLVALIAVALAQLIPGRPGYWLDLGLVMLAFYLLGCAGGAWLRSGVLARQAKAA